MKTKLFSILFVAMYLAAMFRPAIYFAEYFANYDYIKEELCKNKDKPFLKCNGTCYVESLLKSANLLDEPNSQKSTLPEAKIFFPVFVLNTFEFTANQVKFSDKKEQPTFEKHFLIHHFINEVFQPPQIA